MLGTEPGSLQGKLVLLALSHLFNPRMKVTVLMASQILSSERVLSECSCTVLGLLVVVSCLFIP